MKSNCKTFFYGLKKNLILKAWQMYVSENIFIKNVTKQSNSLVIIRPGNSKIYETGPAIFTIVAISHFSKLVSLTGLT